MARCANARAESIPERLGLFGFLKVDLYGPSKGGSSCLEFSFRWPAFLAEVKKSERYLYDTENKKEDK